MSDRLLIAFALDGDPAESVTCVARSSPYVLLVQTVLPQRGVAVELHSTFVGHAGVRTHATHLLLGPVGQAPVVIARAEDAGIVDPVGRPDSCVYAHCHELIGLLAQRGLHVTVDQLPTQLVPISQ